MSYEPDRRAVSPLIGDLLLPPDLPDDAPVRQESVPALVELNALYPGGLEEVQRQFLVVIWRDSFRDWAGAALPAEESTEDSYTEPRVPPGLRRVTPKLFQCVLTRDQLHRMVEFDRSRAQERDLPPAVFKVWPDYQLKPQVDRSAATVKADAGWRSYNARGRGIVWAVMDSGVHARHPHFSSLEIGKEARLGTNAATTPTSRTAALHRDFRQYVHMPDGPDLDGPSPLVDEQGHGTHVAGIISGRSPVGAQLEVAASEEPIGGGFVARARVGELSGMAPECELVSLRVLRRDDQGQYVTSSAALIAALDYLRSKVNVDPGVLRVHGVNISLGCPWDPTHYAAGQSPLSQAVNQLVDSGVVVVVSAGNSGAGHSQDAPNPVAALGSITEPAHADNCIAVGSTHREAPHAFGVTWTSSKGPTLDGRLKPDVVAPGEWITSAAVGGLMRRAGLEAQADGDAACRATYAEQSGTSMAAPHVSGVIAAFLSARPEFIGRPRAVKKLLMDCATDLGRERYAQGAGLVDLMRMLSSV